MLAYPANLQTKVFQRGQKMRHALRSDISRRFTLASLISIKQRGWTLSRGAQVVGIDIVVCKSRTFYVRGRIVGFNATYKHTRVKLEAVGVGWEIGSRS